MGFRGTFRTVIGMNFASCEFCCAFEMSFSEESATLSEPRQPRIMRTLPEQNKAYEAPAQKPCASKNKWKPGHFREKRGAGDYPYKTGRGGFPPGEGGKRCSGYRRDFGRPNETKSRHEEDGGRKRRRTDGSSSDKKRDDEPERKDK